MLRELRQLLAACPPNADMEQYRTAIVDDNVLLKKTLSTRRESFRRLRELYALHPAVLLFSALRELWDADVEAQPLLALLCSSARDPILRATASVISIPLGSPVNPHMISKATSEAFPDRYNPTMLANVGRHAASSWEQSGHLQGRLTKVRARATSRPTAVAYALLLGYLCGARGEALFQTFWAQLLDAPPDVLHAQAVAASQQGWLEYRRGGDVTDISFYHFLAGRILHSE
ncbi:MAG: hypothetical protein U0822_22795 [Anaerolineae bacterium]